MTTSQRFSTRSVNILLSSSSLEQQERIDGPVRLATRLLHCTLDERLMNTLDVRAQASKSSTCAKAKKQSSPKKLHEANDNIFYGYNIPSREPSLESLFSRQHFNIQDVDDDKEIDFEDSASGARLNKLAEMLDQACHSTAASQFGRSCPELYMNHMEEDKDISNSTSTERHGAIVPSESHPLHEQRHNHDPPIKVAHHTKCSRADIARPGRSRYHRRNSFVIPHTSRELLQRRSGIFSTLPACIINHPPSAGHGRSESEGHGAFGLSQEESRNLLRRWGESHVHSRAASTTDQDK